MNYKDGLEFLSKSQGLGIMLGLDRVRILLEKLGNPQNNYKIIHVAGTNGKGSTCKMLSEILKEAGFTTGLFSSPVIMDFREQFQINGQWITEEEFADVITQVKEAAVSMSEMPTEFELLVAVAFLYFSKRKCDYAVVEVGMGGKEDATNAISNSYISVITNIDLDHMGFLGDTREEIAACKAGIIKQNGRVVVADQDDSIKEVIRASARAVNGQCFEADSSKISLENVELSLKGEHQIRNLATVLEVVKLIRDDGEVITDEVISRALNQVSLPGRFEIVSSEPPVIIDGAHNPHGIKALTNNLDLYFKEYEFVFVIGILADKNYSKMIKELIPYAKAFITIEPDNPRALDREGCAKAILGSGFKGEIICSDGYSDAVNKAWEIIGEAVGGTKCIGMCTVGSLYNVKGIKGALSWITKK